MSIVRSFQLLFCSVISDVANACKSYSVVVVVVVVVAVVVVVVVVVVCCCCWLFWLFWLFLFFYISFFFMPVFLPNRMTLLCRSENVTLWPPKIC